MMGKVRVNMLFEENDTLVMIGDSVTDCGRCYEAELGGWGAYGDGYAMLVDAFLTGIYPELKMLVINKGINGNTVADLEKRWDADVLSLNPDWVSVLVGVNDVWRQFDGIFRHVPVNTPKEYEAVYRGIIEKTLPKVKGMIIMSPFMMEANEENPMKRRIREYAAAAEKLALEYKLIYVDLQSKFDAFLRVTNEFIITQDRVHPNVKGHSIIAKAFLDAAGFDWSR